MPKQNPSSRSTGKVTLSFGLVNIPIALYTGIDAKAGVERHEYLPVPVMDPDDPDKQLIRKVEQEDGSFKEVPVFEDHLIGRGNTDKTTGELLTPDERAKVQSKVSTEYGPVYVEDSEIEKLFTLDNNTLKINEFQPQHLFHQGNYVPKKLMFVEPEKAGSGAKKAYMPIAVKLLHMLLTSMRQEGVVAIGELTTRGVPKPVILDPRGQLWEVYHTNALREQREIPEVELADAEVQMMRGLIDQMKTEEVADLSDKRSELIQNFAEEKAAAGDFGKPADDVVVNVPAEPAQDIMAMLAASVEQAKADRAEAV